MLEVLICGTYYTDRALSNITFKLDLSVDPFRARQVLLQLCLSQVFIELHVYKTYVLPLESSRYHIHKAEICVGPLSWLSSMTT